MGKCKYCGRNGFFLFVDEDGLCKKCAPLLKWEVDRRVRIIKESDAIIKRSKNTSTICSRYNTILANLNRFIELEQKGLTPINDSAKKLFQEVSEERNSFLSTVPSHVAGKDEDSFESRVLCSDGNCNGIIGPNGRCIVCGKLNEQNESSTNNLIAAYEEEARKKNQAASVDGKHYTGYVEQVEQLKRERRHKEAIELLLKLIEAVERESKVDKSYGGDGFCAPWYYRHLAIIYRKEKQYSEEVAILERLQKQNNILHQDLVERLRKAKELQGRRERTKSIDSMQPKP
jgi:tetratricopeptide (TPR) repeat protein